jgi:penicillin-binding protein 2
VSFHPNDVARRGRAATIIVCGALVLLLSAFFRTQVLRNQQLLLQSEENRLREVPLPAPRGVIYDRNNQPIAESVVGYSVSLIPQSEDSLRATLTRLRETISLSQQQFDDAVRRYRRDRSRPAVILADASFDLISVLEEHRMDFPNLSIQAAPKRVYPAGKAVSAFAGYIGEISERELASRVDAGYKAGQQIGKQGLELQYEQQLRGREGVQFVEVDARGRPVRRGSAIEDIAPVPAQPLYTNIDLDLQTYIHTLFGDTLSGGAVAMVPQTGEVLAVYSSPAIDFNRFIGGVPKSYYDSLLTNERHPLVNKALQGIYPPGSTWKLATASLALEHKLVDFKDHMPQPCTGYYYFGNRAWRCWEKSGHGSLDLTGAIEKSCDVYFYQLGQRLGLARMVAGGVSLGFNKKTSIDLPEETRPRYPDRFPEYFNERWGPRGWTEGATVLNLSIGQGENSQTILNMARFYSALATDGSEATPHVARVKPQRTKVLNLTETQLDQLRGALTGVVASGGTAAGAAVSGLVIAGKTGSAQSGRFVNGLELNHAWFVGFAPAKDPKIVVAVMLEYVPFHGSVTARIATQIIAHFLRSQPVNAIETTG